MRKDLKGRGYFLHHTHKPSSRPYPKSQWKRGRGVQVHGRTLEVWPSGKALGWQATGPRVRIRFGCPFSSEVVVCGHCLVTSSLTINEALKCLSSSLILMQVIQVVAV